MRADDPRHGTTRGFSAGCRETCCREARNADERRRRKHRQVLGITRSVPARGTQRRIRALMAIGWTSAEIAKRCGWSTPQAVTELLTTRLYVYAATAHTIAEVYEGLCMTIGPSEKNRRDALRKGWSPPLAWDDIDHDPAPVGVKVDPSDIDPAVVARCLAGDFVPATRAERVAVSEAWVASGRAQNELERASGWNVTRDKRLEAQASEVAA